MAARTMKISCSLPRELVESLDSVAESMGVTRSALMTALLGKSVEMMDELVKQVMIPEVTSEEIRRRGVTDTLLAIEQQLDKLKDDVNAIRQ